MVVARLVFIFPPGSLYALYDNEIIAHNENLSRALMIENKITGLLSVEKSTKPVSVRVPEILLDRMIAAYRKKVGAVKERGITTDALLYFAARGVIDWEDQHREDVTQKKPSRRSSEG